MSEDEIHQTIAVTPASDRAFEALMGLLEITAEAETQAALNPSSDANQRAFDCGRASSLRDLLSDIKNIREQYRADD